MPRSNRRKPSDGKRTVRIAGRSYPVINELMIRRHRYLLAKKASGPGRTRYLAADADAAYQPCLVLILPRSEAADAHIRALKRLPPGNVNLPRILAFETAGNEIRMVLTWVSGIDLKSYLDSVKAKNTARPSAFECVRLIRGLAHGLRALHRNAQLVHADLTPANLILTSHNSHLVTVDFGSAWAVERYAYREAADGMTSVYAAPELHNGAPANFRCDHFSASVILYELLTLNLPYANLGGKAGRSHMVDRMKHKFVPPSKSSPDRQRMPRSIWEGIDSVVATGLAMEPDDRFATPRAWLDAIDAVYTEMQYRARRHEERSGGPLSRAIDWLALRMVDQK